MIANTNTIINPWAVMIVSFHAFIANSAMSGSWSADHLAIGAEVGWVELLEQFYEIEVWVRFQGACVSGSSEVIGEEDFNTDH